MYATVNLTSRQATIALIFLFAGSIASATEFVRPRPLSKFDDILLAQELDTVINVLNNRITLCVDAGRESPTECFCRYPEEANNAKKSYDKILLARPNWRGKILYWQTLDNQASHQLVMPAVENQLRSSTLTCSTSTSR